MIESSLIVGMKRLQRDALIALVVNQPTLFAELLRLALYGTQVQRMKGSWVLSGIHAKNASLLQPYYDEVLTHLTAERIGGVKRELLKCFMKSRLSSEAIQQLVLITMEWVTDDEQDLAVRYACFKILKERLANYPELKAELQDRIELYRDKFGRFP